MGLETQYRKLHQQFYVRLTFGVSTNSYSYSNDFPIEGSGQGISWAGPCWRATSTAISNIMRRSNTGMSFSDPTGDIQVDKSGVFFVDDTATDVSENNMKDSVTLLKNLRRDEQKHAFLLFAAGHFLALFKCIFYVYQFKRVETKFVHTSNTDLPGDLHLKSKYDGKYETVRRLEPYEVHKTLRRYISVNMNQEEQLEIITDMMKDWVMRIQSSQLIAADKFHAYKTILEKKTVVCLTYDKILSPLLLNANVIQKKCNRNALYTSRDYGGLVYGDFIPCIVYIIK